LVGEEPECGLAASIVVQDCRSSNTQDEAAEEEDDSGPGGVVGRRRRHATEQVGLEATISRGGWRYPREMFPQASKEEQHRLRGS
jgi:hypothetical protein